MFCHFGWIFGSVCWNLDSLVVFVFYLFGLESSVGFGFEVRLVECLGDFVFGLLWMGFGCLLFQALGFLRFGCSML